MNYVLPMYARVFCLITQFFTPFYLGLYFFYRNLRILKVGLKVILTRNCKQYSN